MIYHPKIEFRGRSNYDERLVVATFEPDSGEVDSYLSMEPVYTDNYDGSIRTDYGAKYNDVAKPSVTLVDVDGNDISPYKVKSVLRWITGSRQNAWLNIYNIDGEIVCSYLGRFTDVKLQKMDARVIGIRAEFTSVSPWAYSEIQTVEMTISGDADFSIDNESDDLYSYIYPNIVFTNSKNLDSFSITNSTIIEGDKVEHFIGDGEKKEYELTNYFYSDSIVTINGVKTTQCKYNEETGSLEFDTAPSKGSVIEVDSKIRNRAIFKNLQQGEVITIDNNFVVYSDNTARIFDDDFNFEFPALSSGTNKFHASGNGKLTINFRYPMKVSDGLLNDYEARNNIIIYVDNKTIKIKGDTTRNPPSGVNIKIEGTTMSIRGEIKDVEIHSNNSSVLEVENSVLVIDDNNKVCPFDDFNAEVQNGVLIIKKDLRDNNNKIEE